MIDYLMSKMVWIVAAVVLTASVLGVYSWQRRSMEDVALDEQAEQVAELVNKLSTTVGEFKGLVTFNRSRDAAFYLDETVNREPYILNFTQKSLFVNQGTKGTWKTFVGNVHLFDPYYLDADDTPILGTMDIEVNHLFIRSGEDFYIETKRFQEGYNVFIYPEPDRNIRNDLRYLGGAINENVTWRFEGDLNMSAINATYHIELMHDTLFLRDLFYYPNSSIIPFPVSTVHLWESDRYVYSLEELNELDQDNPRLSGEEGDTIRLDRRVIILDGNHTVEGFLYVP